MNEFYISGRTLAVRVYYYSNTFIVYFKLRGNKRYKFRSTLFIVNDPLSMSTKRIVNINITPDTYLDPFTWTKLYFGDYLVGKRRIRSL